MLLTTTTSTKTAKFETKNYRNLVAPKLIILGITKVQQFFYHQIGGLLSSEKNTKYFLAFFNDV